MFGKLSSYLHSAAHILAPETRNHDQFVTHWKAVTAYFVNCKDEKAVIESTKIPQHMSDMLRLLAEEEDGIYECDRTGPCLEYLLQHSVLDTMFTMARSDSPAGVKQQVLIFYSKFISWIKHPVLPHVSVHSAYHKLVKLCGRPLASPSEEEEIQFICTLCAKIKTSPHLINLFIEEYEEQGDENSPQGKSYSLSLLESLLRLMFSPNARVSVHACEGLMLIGSLAEEKSINVIACHSKFSHTIIGKLTELFDALPREVNPTEVECVSAKWGLDMTSSSEDIQNFHGKRSIISFLSWLDYIDQLVQVSHPDVARSICEQFSQHFLQCTCTSAFLQQSETRQVTAMVFINKIFSSITSELLLEVFIEFLLLDQSERKGKCVMRQIIDRCNHLSDEVSIAALRLMEVIVLKHNFQSLKWLVLPCSVHNRSEKSAEALETNFLPQDVVNYYLSIVPDVLKTSSHMSSNSYDTYLRDAHRLFEVTSKLCSRHMSQLESSDVVTTIDSCEPPLLKLLLDKISRLLDQSYCVNLQVTSLVSHLCLLSYEIDQLDYPTRAHCPRSLSGILEKVAQDALTRLVVLQSKGDHALRDQLLAVRKYLLGESGTLKRSQPAGKLFGVDDVRTLEGVIILEEFCMELGAITFVKCHVQA